MTSKVNSGVIQFLANRCFSTDGTSLLTNKEAILKRWAEHFDYVLNRPSAINGEAINRLPHGECNPLLDEFPTVSETVKTRKLLSASRRSSSCRETDELFHIM